MAAGLFDFIAGAEWRDLPPDARRMSRRCLTDLIGVAAAGAATPLSRIIRDHAAAEFGGGAARMLMDGRRVSASGAALAGGMTIDSVDAHDGHPLTKGHAGCGLFPALVAMIEAEGAAPSGAEFLTALAIGYEISIRAGIALHATAADYHTSGAWVSVGAAALAARIMGLTRQQAREAMGIAEYHGPRSQMMRAIDHPTMVKDGSGWGAMAGVSAAYLARAGFTGAPALTVEDQAVAGLWSDLGSRWRITEQYFKPWPVCRWAQPAAECALALKRAHGLAPEEIASIRVESFHEATRLSASRPRNTEEAQYSLPFPVAAALARGRIGPEEISGDGLSDPEILRLAALVEMVEDQRFNALFPAERWARVEIVTRDGRRLESAPMTAHGDASDPLSEAEIDAKFDALTASAGRSPAPLRAAIKALEDGPAAPLIELVTAPVVSPARAAS